MKEVIAQLLRIAAILINVGRNDFIDIGNNLARQLREGWNTDKEKIIGGQVYGLVLNKTIEMLSNDPTPPEFLSKFLEENKMNVGEGEAELEGAPTAQQRFDIPENSIEFITGRLYSKLRDTDTEVTQEELQPVLDIIKEDPFRKNTAELIVSKILEFLKEGNYDAKRIGSLKEELEKEIKANIKKEYDKVVQNEPETETAEALEKL